MSDAAPERAADILAKHESMTALFRDSGRDGLLVLDPVNFPWLTGGATAKGVLNRADHPALYFHNSQRTILCSNVETQRLFDEELDGLGFQLKEWPWHRGRARLLADLRGGKSLACDVPLSDCEPVGDRLRTMRRALSPWDQHRLLEAGKLTAHALEATCRNLDCGETEQQIAGQLSYRLMHHGLEPRAIAVAADGRLKEYRRLGSTPTTVERTCVLQATVRAGGLHITASRCASFGPADDEFLKEFDAACRLTAVQIAGSIVGAKPSDGVLLGQRVLLQLGMEHEWRLAPAGHLTGFVPVEFGFTPDETPETLLPGWPLVWHGSIGAAACTDTVLVTDAGPKLATPADLWPLKRLKVSGALVERPEILVR
jgi:Xaa-Pro dipeptidase